MPRKRLVLFVEGEGDDAAVPALVKKILAEMNPWEYLLFDEQPFRVGGIQCLTGRRQGEWLRFLQAAARSRRDLGGVLLLLDGDAEKVEQQPFCAMRVAKLLSERARQAGAGALFSVACVFACREYESWLIAGVESLRGRALPDGREGVKEQVGSVPPDTETAPRGAKQWLAENMCHGYKPSTDQEPLTRLLTLEAVRQRKPRSFRRLENAVRQLAQAIRTGNHIPLP